MHNPNPLVSIIMISYNVEKYIEEALHTCFIQDYKNIELICIDDGSIDSTYEKIKELSIQKKNAIKIQILKKENGGPNSARKEGLKYATGDYIFFMDGDDMIPSNAISSLVKESKEYPYDIIFGSFKIVTSNNKHNIFKYKIAKENSGIKTLETYLYSPKAIWGKLLKRKLFTQYKINYALDLKIGEDAVLMTQLLYYSQKVCNCHEITYIYRAQRSESLYTQYGQSNNYLYLTPSYLYISQFLRRKEISNSSIYFNFFHSYIYNYLSYKNTNKNLHKDIKEIAYNITYKSLPNYNKTIYILYFLLRINVSLGIFFIRSIEFYGKIKMKHIH